MGDHNSLMLAYGDELIDGLIAIILVVGPLWLILHYVTKLRAARQLDAQERQAFDHLQQTAARMERRMGQLERILDAEAPAWRERSGAYDDEKI